VTPLGTSWSEWLVRRLAKSLIYDIDDNVHLGQELDDAVNPNRLLRYLKNRDKPITLMRSADHVIASSPFLEETAREFNKLHRATYITSSVDVSHFTPRKRRPDNPQCVIGWTGTFSSQPFLDSLAPMFRRLSETHAFEFRIVGNFDYAMPGVDLKVVRFDKAREIADLEHFDIGIYPLVDDPFVYGKSGLKAIVYMAMGLPVVASAIGTTPLVVRDGENGFLVKSEDEWLKALRRLIDDPELRSRLGEQARRDAVARFSVQAVASQYRRVLTGVTESMASREESRR
jgi:glycosyltransferase involved in cell wall biosynthesis